MQEEKNYISEIKTMSEYDLVTARIDEIIKEMGDNVSSSHPLIEELTRLGDLSANYSDKHILPLIKKHP